MDRAARHDLILELISRNEIDSQEQLLDLLGAEGVVTTQSTLSRDLRALGVAKGDDGLYRRSAPATRPPEDLAELARELREQLARVDAAGHNVLLRTTPPGVAEALARRIDSAGLPGVLAAVAGPGLVVVFSRSPADARALARELNRPARRRPGFLGLRARP